MRINDLPAIIDPTDAFIVVDHSVRPMIFSGKMSASSMFALDQCHARYAIEKILRQVEEAVDDPLSPTSIGSSVHSILEKFMSQAPSRRTRTGIARTCQRLSQRGKLSLPTDQDQLELWQTEVLSLAESLLDLEDVSKVDVVSVETPMHGNLWGVPISGFIDRLDTQPDGTFKVVDYKTGKPPRAGNHDMSDQLIIYAAWVDEHRQVTVSSAADYFLRHKKVSEITPSPARIKITKNRFQSAFDVAQSLSESMRFRYSTSALCGWCPFVSQCPAAAEKGLVAKATVGHFLENVNFKPSVDVMSVIPGKQVVKEKIMKYREGKVWEPLLNDGSINPASYSSVMAGRVADLAIAQSVKHLGLQNKTHMLETARLIQFVVDSAIVEVTGDNSVSMGAAIWSRLFFSLKDHIYADQGIDFDDPESWAVKEIKALVLAYRLSSRIAAEPVESDSYLPNYDVLSR